MIYLSAPHISSKEFELVNEALKSGWIAPNGAFLDNFEKQIAIYTNSPNCVATISGTAALHLALCCLNISEGDYVLVPSFTFVATINAILYQKAIPVFIDSEPETWGIDAEIMKLAIAKLPKVPKAIIVVHAYGTPAKLKEIINIANENGIEIIEDAAAALGSTYMSKMCGTFGKIGIYSFNGNKIITTSQGGAMVSNDAQITQKARHLASQAKITGLGFEHDSMAYNYRLSNILSALGTAQLEKIEEKISAKKAIFKRYVSNLSDNNIDFLDDLPHSVGNKWLTNIRFSNADLAIKCLEKLSSNKIEARQLWKPLHLQKPFESFPRFVNGFSEKLFSRGISLPSGTGISNLEIDKVSEIVKSCV